MDDIISIIIPCYNQGHFLNDAIDSVLKQTYSNWECIIVDDGSSDNTKEIASNFVQLDKRFRYIYKTNGGLSSARNRGIEKVSGKWIQFLDADDVLEPRKFSTQLDSVKEYNEITQVVIYSDYAFGHQDDVYQNEGGRLPVQFKSGAYFEELISRWETDLIIPCHTFLFSSSLFLKNSICFDEILPNHEDFDCWLMVFSSNPLVIFNNEVLCRYRLSNHSMSTNMKLMGEGFLKVLDKHLESTLYSGERHSLLKKKRLEVLQRYKRFDMMSLKEKFASIKILSTYYSKKIVEKLTSQKW
ncbi:MAG: glycosyltransferase family 2 protein [Ferruginibacter sp.]